MLIDAFRKALEKNHHIKPDTEFLRHEDLIKLIEDKHLRKKLKVLHIRYFGDINTSGLVVLHGPLKQVHTESHHKRPLFSGRQCYTLLNGDCSLYTVAYPDYIRSAMPFIRFFQIPHHGSVYSWHDLPEFDDLQAVSMIVNYGTSNRYRHPHDKVINQVSLMHPRWKLKHNTEKQSCQYHITSYI